MPRGPLPGNDPALLVVDGFITRSVADNALLLDVVSGPALGDPVTAPSPPRPFGDEVMHAPNSLRIGWTATPVPGLTVDPACAAAVEEAARLSEELGHHVEPVALNWGSDTLANDFLDLWAGLIGANIDFYTSLGGNPDLVEPHNRALRERARGIDAAQLMVTMARLQGVARQVLAASSSYDLILTPTLALPPVPLGWHFQGAEVDPMAVLTNAARFTPFASVANLTGQPVAALPLSWHEGLPIGVSAFGRPYDEATLFRYRAQVEAARPWGLTGGRSRSDSPRLVAGTAGRPTANPLRSAAETLASGARFGTHRMGPAEGSADGATAKADQVRLRKGSP